MNVIHNTLGFVKTAVNFATPIVASEVIKAGFHDPRIGKIVGGVGLIGSGIYLIGASTFKTRSWKSLSAMQVGAGLTGVATICYGAHNVAKGMLELLYPEETSLSCPPILLRIKTTWIAQLPAGYPAIDGTYTPKPECDKPQDWPAKEQMIVQTLQGCSWTRKLEEAATQTQAQYGLPPLQIKIVSPPAWTTGAISVFDRGEIQIDCNHEQPTSVAAFELENFKNYGRSLQAFNDVFARKITDRNIYAEDLEKMEYDGVLDHITMMEQCSKERGWMPSVQLWNRMDWNSWWSMMAPSAHAERYRHKFDEYQQSMAQ